MKIRFGYRANGLFVIRYRVKLKTKLIKKVLSSGKVVESRVKIS